MKKFSVYLCVVMLLIATCLAANTPAFAIPSVDGFLGVNEYSNSFVAGWYNGHKQEFSQFQKTGDHTTTVYYESTATSFYLYLEAPLEAKNMLWGTGVTDAEAQLYYQQFSTHHKETLEEFKTNKTDFGTMTGSEKVIFGTGPIKDSKGYEVFDSKNLTGIKADLAGGVTIGNNYLGLSLINYMDSVDYVTNTLGCNDINCDAANIPMAFEFEFAGLTQAEINALIADIQTNELEFHLSPERGGTSTPVPEPTTMLLLGAGLIGLARFRKKFTAS